MTLVGNRCSDIIACTCEIIPHSVSRRQWCGRIVLYGPSKTQRPKTDPFWKSRVQFNDSWRLWKWRWISSILSLWAKCTQNDGEHRVWLNKWSWLELWQRKKNTASILRSKRESPWLLPSNLQGVGLCVNSNLVGSWVGRVIISLPLVRYIIVGVRCQCQ